MDYLLKPFVIFFVDQINFYFHVFYLLLFIKSKRKMENIFAKSIMKQKVKNKKSFIVSFADSKFLSYSLLLSLKTKYLSPLNILNIKFKKFGQRQLNKASEQPVAAEPHTFSGPR